MRNKIEKQFSMTALAVALAASYGTAWADSQSSILDDVARRTTPDSWVSVGVGNWSGNRHQQGIYDGMRDGKAYGLLDLNFVKRDNATGTWLTLSGQNLGLESREFSAEWLRQGDVGVSFDYSRTQRDNPLTFTTGLQGIGTTNQVISGTAPANTLPRREISLGTTRDLIQLGLYKNIMPNLDLRVSFKNEKKEGTRQWGLGSAPLFMVEPIDSTTRQLDIVLDYAGERLQMSGGYLASFYDNAHSLVLGRVNGVANSAAGPNPASPTSLALPLDNQAHQLFLNGGYSFTPTTRGTFKLSYGKALQDETLPVAFNVIPRAGSPSRLDGRIDTTQAEIGVTSRPLPKLSLVAKLAYHQSKDKTPVAQYVDGGYNTPHSYIKRSGKLEANYRLPERFTLIGGVEVNQQNRSVPIIGTLYVPFRTKLDETTYRLQLRRSLSDTLNGSLAYLQSDRSGSEYTSTGNTIRDSINPTHIADRNREKWRVMVDWSPVEQLSLQLTLDKAQDKYGPTARPNGLRDGSADLYSLDMNYTLNDNWKISGWMSRDDTKAREIGYLTSAANSKDAQLREIGDSFGFGLVGQASADLQIGANLEWNKSVSKYPQAMIGGVITPGLSPLADITNKVIRLKFFGDYAVDKNSSVRLELAHERWQTDDWTWSFSTGAPFTFGTNTDGTMVTSNPKQSVNFVGARYIYKFQ